jgi:hypothetical protein
MTASPVTAVDRDVVPAEVLGDLSEHSVDEILARRRRWC